MFYSLISTSAPKTAYWSDSSFRPNLITYWALLIYLLHIKTYLVNYSVLYCISHQIHSSPETGNILFVSPDKLAEFPLFKSYTWIYQHAPLMRPKYVLQCFICKSEGFGTQRVLLWLVKGRERS